MTLKQSCVIEEINFYQAPDERKKLKNSPGIKYFKWIIKQFFKGIILEKRQKNIWLKTGMVGSCKV